MSARRVFFEYRNQSHSSLESAKILAFEKVMIFVPHRRGSAARAVFINDIIIYIIIIYIIICL